MMPGTDRVDIIKPAQMGHHESLDTLDWVRRFLPTATTTRDFLNALEGTLDAFDLGGAIEGRIVTSLSDINLGDLLVITFVCSTSKRRCWYRLATS